MSIPATRRDELIAGLACARANHNISLPDSMLDNMFQRVLTRWYRGMEARAAIREVVRNAIGGHEVPATRFSVYMSALGAMLARHVRDLPPADNQALRHELAQRSAAPGSGNPSFLRRPMMVTGTLPKRPQKPRQLKLL